METTPCLAPELPRVHLACGHSPRDLVRAHYEASVSHCRELPTLNAAHEVRLALARLHRMVATMMAPGPASHALVRAIQLTCVSLCAPLEALRLAEETGVACDATVSGDLFEICFYPVRVLYHEMALPHRGPYLVRALPDKDADAVQVSKVPPQATVLITAEALRGNVGVLVFAAPEKMCTRVEEDVVGLAADACILLFSDSVPCLVQAATTATKGRGALWVWMYARADFFLPAAKQLRQEARSTVVVHRSLALQRRHLAWHLHQE